jgi:hypothetical protein
MFKSNSLGAGAKVFYDSKILNPSWVQGFTDGEVVMPGEI